MAENINRVVLSGNLTRDPEVRATQSGTTLVTFGVASNERRKSPQTGEYEDYPNFVDCVWFGNRAEALSRYMTKGTKVCVSGSLHYSSWDKDGQKRSKLEVVADNVDLMQGGGNGQGQYRSQQAPQRQQYQQPRQAPQQQYPPRQQQIPQQYPPQPQYQQQAPQQAPQQPAMYDEDIPF